jgi:hypothetical protein
MDGTQAAEGRAASLVGVGREEPNGAFHIILRSPGGHPVYLGPYYNRDVANLEASRVRGFVAAVIRDIRCAGPDYCCAGEPIAPSESTAVIPLSDLDRQSRETRSAC